MARDRSGLSRRGSDRSRSGRTAELGGHAEACPGRGFVRCAYNSCRNRHWPKCQGRARAEWLAARQAELLPVPYFHVVFTLPAPVAEIAFQNKKVVYAILFRIAAETLRRIGLVAVLHTWGQSLHHHPHVHCVVPGGGLSPDGTRWIGCRPGFFLPVRALSRHFRRLFLDAMRAAFEAGELGFFGDLAGLAQSAGFSDRLGVLRRVVWVVHARPPFGGPAQVLAYLGRYTHRVAIANSRLVEMTGTDVAFRWKDYRRGGGAKMMSLSAHEFIRRFPLRTLPDGFHRIRHFGFLANGHRAAKLARRRELLDAPAPIPAEVMTDASAGQAEPPAWNRCPCRGGVFIFVNTLSTTPPDRPAFWNDGS